MYKTFYKEYSGKPLIYLISPSKIDVKTFPCILLKVLETQVVNVFQLRLKNYKDIYQLGMFETSSDCIKIVEWPELVEPKPKDRIDILFKYTKLKSSRKVELIGFGKWKDYKFNEI